MVSSKRTEFRVVAAFDTETCNIGRRAYPILYILNDLRNVDLNEYAPDCEGERVTFDRTLGGFLPRLSDLIDDGMANDYVPVVCAYNLMFDMQTLMHVLAESFDLRCNAQSSTHVYTLDVYANEEDSVPLLRFWDTFFLEQNGLRAMGDTAGVAKAAGDWDYSLIRTPSTPLTDLELFYAKRDVQVIPAYLAYLLHANDWLTADMLGVRVLTKTSLVRQMARHEFGGLRRGSKSRKSFTLLRKFESLCEEELPRDYATYALRKACFRGGFTFTAMSTACRDLRNVASLDVTSMHHTFINGRRIPVGFSRASVDDLKWAAGEVLSRSLEAVLEDYSEPCYPAFHMRARFDGIRLRRGSCFEEWGIALEPRGKFVENMLGRTEFADDPAARDADNATRCRGYMDEAVRPVFAFGKLVSADSATLFVNEIELWAMSRVYEWDSLTPLEGEISRSFELPPDYVTLQSNMLFERKADCKHMTKVYDGSPFEGEIPASIPEGLADEMRSGAMDVGFLNNYYNGTVKGMFNAIYGTMAQDVFKPGYVVDDRGEISVDRSSVVTPANFASSRPEHCRVLYTYGMRIVAGSRMHLVIAMELLWRRFGSRLRVTGGDTDSLKCMVAGDVSDPELEAALDPLYGAARAAIGRCMSRVRRLYPEFASELAHVGGFEVEAAGDGTRWDHHMEFWNKARVSESNGHVHVTMAGLSRPLGAYHIERFMDDLLASGNSFRDVASLSLGYNANISNEVCYALQTHRPSPESVYDGDVTDYLGVTSHVRTYEAVALYPVSRLLGDTAKEVNNENVEWLRSHGVEVRDDPRDVVLLDGNPAVVGGFAGDVRLLEGVRHG